MNLVPLLWASAAFAGGVLLNADRVPPWVPVAALLIVAWRLLVAWRPAARLPLPASLPRSLMTLLLVAAVAVRFRTLNGLTAGTALLMLMGAIKLLETHSRRDRYIVIGSALFLLLAACLERQDLPHAVLYLLHAWLCCAALAVVSYDSEPGGARVPSTAGAANAFSGRSAVLLAGRALLFAVPFAVALFLFFPRLAGAFWTLPRPDAAATGLGDTMSPGSITELTSSYEVAFRARFEGSPPPPQERYWRGPVLHEFDGFTWRRTPGFYLQPRIEYLGQPYRYRISLEPSAQRWWFALDTPHAAPEGRVYFTYDFELVSAEPVTEPTSYIAVSSTTTRGIDPLSRLTRRRDTALPESRNPRSVSLARELRAHSDTDAAFVQAVLKFLREGGFAYSLRPPPLGENSVDDFLFGTRRGFCGHYASAFVDLMRAAGVPAHVVTGYLGGEWNPIGDYFIVRQSDAHAWAEVWLEGRGWTRVDPTAVVQPERLQRGILDLLPDAVSAPARMVRGSRWLTALVQRWDALNTWWNDRVVRFDFNTQLDVLQWLGIDSPDVRELGWAFAAGLIGWLLWIAWQVGRSPGAPRADRLARAYLSLCRKLARTGVSRALHQGPLDYAAAVGARRPDLSGEVRALLERYAQLRFGAHSPAAADPDIASFERSVARLSVGRAP
jgi:transglutaminase-like putative cysteine protease